MLSFKDTRDFLLLSCGMKFIKDGESGLIFDTSSSLNLDLPNDSFTPFDMSQLNEDECSAHFFQFQRTKYCLELFFDVSTAVKREIVRFVIQA